MGQHRSNVHTLEGLTAFPRPDPTDVGKIVLLGRVGNWFKPAEIQCIYATGWHKLIFTWLKLV